MLALPHTNSWGFVYTNFTGAGALGAQGASVVPGASDVEGSFTEIAGDADITSEIQYVRLLVQAGATAGQAKNHLLDFAWDPSGGTTYDQILFQDLVCGGSATTSGGFAAREYHFPCKIPAGSAVAVRIQGSNATAGTVRVAASFYGKPSRPELWRPAAYAETIGTITGSLGVSFTPGDSTAYGNWASLGTTAKKHFWAQLGCQCDNGTVNSLAYRMQLAIGDGTNQHLIAETQMNCQTVENWSSTLSNPCQWEIPAGAELWVRGSCSGATATGWNATAVLFGG